MGNIRAIAMMTGSMACFAVGDTLVKLASASLTVAQVIIVMASIGATIFLGLLIRSGQPVFTRLALAPAVVTRNIVEALTAICMVSALSMAPMSLVVSIVQAVPLLVTFGAAVILRETVGPRRWAAVALGFVGVLIMLRPDASGGLVGPLLALAAAFGLAARDLCTRLVPREVSTLQMAAWGMLSALPAGLLMLPFTAPQPPLFQPGLWIALAAALATAAGYFAITAAMRMGTVSVVAPFRYSRLLFALILAVVFVGERPDPITLLGAAVVIGSGLFVLWRERRVSPPQNT